MITKLTKEQEAQIPIVRDEWLKLCQSGKDFSVKDIESGIEWLYGLDNLPKPHTILKFEDPLQCQIAANALLHGETIKESVKIAKTGVRQSYYKYIPTLGGLSWRSWYLSYYDFYINNNLLSLDDETKTKFLKFIDLVKHGIWDLIVLDEVCLVCTTPTTKRDGDMKLHSTNGQAVTFKSGYGFYAIHGVVFEKNLFEKVVNRKLTNRELFGITNIEQRRVAMNHYGWDRLWDDLDKTFVNRSNRDSEAELYRVRNLAGNNIEINMVQYRDQSTGRRYVSQVPDDDDYGKKIKTADHAMAWKSSMTVEEYAELKVEG